MNVVMTGRGRVRRGPRHGRVRAVLARCASDMLEARRHWGRADRGEAARSARRASRSVKLREASSRHHERGQDPRAASRARGPRSRGRDARGPGPTCPTPDEPGPDFLDERAAKALYYHVATGLPAVGEDSGPRQSTRSTASPGIHSARWLGEDTSYDVKNARLLERLAGVAEAERTARYVSAVALVGGRTRSCSRPKATCEGRIAVTRPSGPAGSATIRSSSYPPLGKTIAELSARRRTG